MKTTRMSRITMKAVNVVVLLMLVISQGGWMAVRVSADAKNPPVIGEGETVKVQMSTNGSPVPFNLSLHATGIGTLTWSVDTQGSHGTAACSGTGGSQVVGYTPQTDYEGDDSFVVKVDDGDGGVDTILVQVGISPGVWPAIQMDIDGPNSVEGDQWPAGAEVTLTIDDPSNGPSIDYTDTQTVIDSGDIFNNKVNFDLGSFAFQPGFIVTLTGAGVTRSMPVGNPRVVSIDTVNDTISGTADPNWEINVWTNTIPQANRHTTADSLGNWSVDFSELGTRSDEQTLLDIAPGVSGWMGESYSNESGSWQGSIHTRWKVLTPRIGVSLYLDSDHVDGYGWAVGTPLTLTIDDPSTPAPVDNTFQATIAPAQYSDPAANFNLPYGYHLKAGFVLTVSGAGSSVTYTIPNVRVTSINTETDVITGVATPGANLWVCFNGNGWCKSRNPVAGSFGNWVADFTAAGTTPDNPDNVADLQIGSHGWVTEFDSPDSNTADSTRYDWAVQNLLFNAQIVQNSVEAYGWWRGSSVTLTIDDPSNGVGVDVTRTQAVNSDGSASFNDLGGLTLAPGMLLTLTDMYTTKSLTVTNLVVTGVDPGLDTVSGTGTPGATIDVQHCDTNNNCQWIRHATVQPDGTWQANFSVAGPGADEKQLLDITPGTQGMALQADTDGDQTEFDWSVPYIHAFYLKASAAGNWVHAYGWQDKAELTLMIDHDPGQPYTATMGKAPWDSTSPVADIAGVFDLNGAYDLQPGDVLSITGAGHTETYTVPATMTQVRWFIGLGTGADGSQVPVELQVADDYNLAHSNNELILEIVASASAHDTLRSEIIAGHAPDIVGPDGLSEFDLFHGQWLDLAPLISSTHFDASIFNPAQVSMYQTDEGQVSLPFTVYPPALYYNPALFDAAGLHHPPTSYGAKYDMDGTMVDWNWDTLTQVAKLLTLDNTGKNSTQTGFNRNNIAQYGFSFGWEGHPNYWGSFWKGGSLLQGTPGKYTAVVPEAWKYAWQWIYDGIWGDQSYMPNGAGSGNLDGGNVFASGKVAMLDNPSWYTCCMGDLVNAGGTFQLGAMPSNNGQVVGHTDADTFRILKGSAHPDQAFNALAYLVTTGVDKLIVGTPGNPPAYGALPALSSKQQPWWDAQKATFPFVTQASWDILKAGLDHPDVPNAVSYMPNFTQAWARIQTFGDLLTNTDGVDLAAQETNLETDLTAIFNTGNEMPSISGISDQSTDEDTTTGPIPFSVGDTETAAAALTVTAVSSNTILVPNGNITLGGSGVHRSISLIPAANLSGTTTITISVNDGTTTVNGIFVLTVNAVNDPPALSHIGNQSTDEGVPTAAIPFTVGDIETPAASLIVTASSSNTVLVPNSNISLGGSGANRTITLTPAANQRGTTAITVSVNDGSTASSNSFVLIVDAVNHLPSISQVLPQQGLGSLPNDIYIYGSNFANGVTARLGTTDLSTLRLSSNQLRATVPQGLAAGIYALTVNNLDGSSASLANAYTVLPEAVDDLYGYPYELWSDPSALQAGQAGQIALVVHRQGGANPLSNVIVNFYLGNPDAGGVLLGNGSIPVLSPGEALSTSGVAWTPTTAGEYTIYAVIDPANQINETVESNNVVSRTVTVLPAAVDKLAPSVDSFVINDGHNPITDLSVSLDTVASDTGGSGIASLLFVQYQYNKAADLWTPVQNSGWLDYATARTNYQWELVPASGVIYLQAWAMDHAGNISLNPYGAYVDYVPPSETVGMGQVNIYRYLLSAGQSITVHVTTISGDPDLYIWAPDYATRLPWISDQSSGDEEISFVAPVAGLYQIEVHGYTTAEYSLAVSLSAATSSQVTRAGRTASGKVTFTQPYVALESKPGDHYVPPPVEAPPVYQIFLPLIKR